MIDLCELELGRPAKRRLSTRIIVARLDDHASSIHVGLIAENVTETLRLEPTDFTPFAAGPRGLVQRIELESLLPAPLQAFLRGDLVNSQ